MRKCSFLKGARSLECFVTTGDGRSFVKGNNE